MGWIPSCLIVVPAAAATHAAHSLLGLRVLLAAAAVGLPTFADDTMTRRPEMNEVVSEYTPQYFR